MTWLLWIGLAAVLAALPLACWTLADDSEADRIRRSAHRRRWPRAETDR